jgi:hypothetical protein
MTASTQTLPASRPRPGLAFVLALLGIPGVTLAWDLPHGGFWIGVPLAIAAVVLGVRALDSSRRRLAIAAVVLGAIELLFTATWTVVAAIS